MATSVAALALGNSSDDGGGVDITDGLLEALVSVFAVRPDHCAFCTPDQAVHALLPDTINHPFASTATTASSCPCDHTSLAC